MKRGLAPLRRAKRITEIVSLIIMIIYFIHFAAIYQRFPESGDTIIVPLFHLEVNEGCLPLFPPFIISVVVLGALIVMDRFPRMYRYPQKITAENIEYQYLMAKVMLNLEIIAASLFFDILFVGKYRKATQGDPGISVPLMFAAAGAAAVIYAVYILKTIKKKQKNPA